MSEAERADWRTYMLASQRAADAGRARAGLPRQVTNRDLPEIPRVKQAFGTFTVADDGRIWVFTTSASVRDTSSRLPPSDVTPPRWRSPIIYDVLGPDGDYVGQVAPPDGLTIIVIRGDTVLGATRNADDVPFVHRYHVAWP